MNWLSYIYASLFQLAEKRKQLLDELAIKYQSESEQHREAVRALEEGHTSQLDSFNTTIDELKVRQYFLMP